jgi:hypothetical protein
MAQSDGNLNTDGRTSPSVQETRQLQHRQTNKPCRNIWKELKRPMAQSDGNLNVRTDFVRPYEQKKCDGQTQTHEFYRNGVIWKQSDKILSDFFSLSLSVSLRWQTGSRRHLQNQNETDKTQTEESTLAERNGLWLSGGISVARTDGLRRRLSKKMSGHRQTNTETLGNAILNVTDGTIWWNLNVRTDGLRPSVQNKKWDGQLNKQTHRKRLEITSENWNFHQI